VGEAKRRLETELSEDLKLTLQSQNTSTEEGAKAAFYDFIKAALRKGLSPPTIIDACLDTQYDGSIFRHVVSNGGRAYVDVEVKHITNFPTAARRGRAVIEIQENHGRTDELWREVQLEAIKRGCILQRFNRLVWAHFKRGDKDNPDAMSLELVPYSKSQLKDFVAHHIVQFKLRDRRGVRDIDPPFVVIDAWIERHEYGDDDGGVPIVVGAITSPTMRKDSSLLLEPGYDKATGLFYRPSGYMRLPTVPDNPTEADADKALQLLNDLIDGFPFEGEKEIKERCGSEIVKSVSRSAALAGIMTSVARVAIDGPVPLFVVTAPDARTGKTFLVHLAGLISTGYIPVPVAGSEKKEEFEKRVETAALTGRVFLHFNNMPNGMVVDSDRLAEFCTEGRVTIRKLGRHEEGDCDCRATVVWLNGNQIKMSKDLVPRSAGIRLNAEMERPEEQRFNFDPMDRVRADRGKYLAAVFTIIRAIRTARRNNPDLMKNKSWKRVAGFEKWSDDIQQALVWRGMADPLGDMEAMRAADPADDNLRHLLHTLDEAFPLPEHKAREKITVAKCRAKAEEIRSFNDGRAIPMHPELYDLMIVKGRIDTAAFGRMLADHEGQIRDGLCIKKSGRLDHANAFILAGKRQSAADSGEPAVKDGL
jgi:hypothetical protein